MLESPKPSTETPESPTPTPESSREAAPEPRRTLQDLLRDPEADTPEKAPEGQAAERPSKAEPPKGLDDVAERLQLKADDLYKLEIPIANGQSMTLGKLKDLAQTQGDFTARELKSEELRVKREGELIRAQQELQELVSSLPSGALKPEVMERIREQHKATLQREQQLTLDAIPAWRDEAKRTEELAGIVEHLKGYGFPAGYLQNVTDHRALRYVRENWLREQRVQRALEQIEKAPPPPAARSKPNGAAARPGARKPGNTDNRSRLLALLDD